MTRAPAAPFARPVLVKNLPPEGLEVTVEATPEERAAVARQLDLPAVHALAGAYRLKGTEKRVAVTGRVTASVAQSCVVTLDPFDAVVAEEVQVDFADGGEGASPAAGGTERDPPDPIVDRRIDLGALTVEFLALGLDPYPRKPGVSFAAPIPDDRTASPLQALARWKGLQGKEP